jgi:uncharacterized protein (TIGR03435 family)
MKARAIANVLACAAGLFGGDLPRFEVATLKQSPPIQGDSYNITLGAIKNGRLYLTNVTLNDCVKFAYDLVSDDQISGPDWIRSKALLYDIVAVVPPNTSHEQVTQMTQGLLADRLKLVVHREQRDMKYLALVSGKAGAKMPLADASQERNNSAGGGRVSCNRASVGVLAMLVSRMERQIVVDRTGLSGEYQIKLLWAPGSAGADVTPPQDSAAPSIFAAVQEQLGLRLEARKGPLDVVVVDQAEKVPAEN